MRFPHKGYREKIWDHAAGYIVIKGIKEKLKVMHSDCTSY